MNKAEGLMRGFVLAAIVFLLTGWSATPDPTGKPSGEAKAVDSVALIRDYKVRLIDSILQVHQKLYHFNGAVLIAEDGDVLYEDGRGYTDFGTRTNIDPYSLFQLASVSKQFTAAATLILYERGKLDLDDDVQKYIPDLPYSGITIKNLLQHTGGMPDYVNENYFDRYFPDTVVRNRDLVEIMKKYRLRVKFKPGTRHSYSNTGYAILSLVIEAAANQPYEDFLRENIFEPLHMNNTYTYTCLASCEDACVVNPYKLRPGKTAKLNNITGDKGIYSCVRDLYAWDQALYTDKIISQETLAKAFEAGKTTYGHTFKYGFGWRIDTTATGSRLIYHRGLWQSYCPAFMRYVDDNKTIIILDNMIPPFSTSRLLEDLSKVVLKNPVPEVMAETPAPELSETLGGPDEERQQGE